MELTIYYNNDESLNKIKNIILNHAKKQNIFTINNIKIKDNKSGNYAEILIK